MKRTARIGILAVATALVFALTACAGTSGEAEPVSEASESEQASQSQQAQTAESENDAKSEASVPAAPEVYTIAIDTASAPAQRRDSHSDWLTIDEEILAAVANDQDFRVEYSYYTDDSNGALASVESGESVGVVGGAAVTDEAKAVLSFSDPYFEDADGVTYALAVPKGQNTDLLEAFNAGLANVKASGKYEEILGKY